MTHKDLRDFALGVLFASSTIGTVLIATGHSMPTWVQILYIWVYVVVIVSSTI